MAGGLTDGTPGGAAGGRGTTGSGSAGVPVNFSNLPITGGLLGINGAVIFAVFDIRLQTTRFMYLDTTNFDTETEAQYTFRVEDLQEGTQVTTTRLRIKYRNLGKAKVQITLRGMYSEQTKTIKLGPGTINGQTRAVPAADNRLYIAYCDFTFTDESPQVNIYRAANSGPLSIISVTMMGADQKPQKGA